MNRNTVPLIEDFGNPRFDRVPISALLKHPQNYKKHPPEQLTKLKASLLRFGQVKPVVVQKVAGAEQYLILAGHGVTQAAMELIAEYPHNERVQMWRDSFAIVIVPSTWTAEDAAGYLVADNKIAELAEDDELLLAALLEEQRSSGADLASVGYSEQELDELLERLAEEELNFAPGNIDDQSSIDQKSPVHCPKCGAEFVP
jgi:ParB-like chromosome segregation protein Spo0J